MEMPIHPIDRWFSSEDRWPLSAVNDLLDEFHATCSDIVYDPFVGCGTTAVAAAIRSCSTFSSDLNPVSALITRYKVCPPSPRAVWSHLNLIETVGVRSILESVVLPPQFTDPNVSLLQFVLATAILRTDWHLGRPWDELRVLSEVQLLCSEICEDVPFARTWTAAHRVSSVDFRHSTLSPSENHRILLVTSPPFFRSDRNPKVVQLTELLHLDWPPEMSSDVTHSVPLIVAQFLQRCDLTPAGRSEVVKYLDFLVQIANHAIAVNCSALAIEMAGASVEGDWLPFDEFLADCLNENGYRVDLQIPVAGRQESERVICGCR
jgi:hypothetical protein